MVANERRGASRDWQWWQRRWGELLRLLRALREGEGESQTGKWESRKVTGEHGQVKVCWSSMWPGRAGHWRRVAHMRRSNSDAVSTVGAIQFGHQSEWSGLTVWIADVQTPKPWSISANNLTQSCSPIYHLWYLLKDQGLIPKEWGVKSFQSRASETGNQKYLEKFLSVVKQWIVDFCELKMTKLCTELTHDPKIKVVALLKYYNFA